MAYSLIIFATSSRPDAISLIESNNASAPSAMSEIIKAICNAFSLSIIVLNKDSFFQRGILLLIIKVINNISIDYIYFIKPFHQD